MRCVCYRYRKNILIPIHVLRLWFVVTQASGVERWGTVWGASPPHFSAWWGRHRKCPSTCLLARDLILSQFSIDCFQNAFASRPLPRTPLGGGLQRAPRPPAGKVWVTHRSFGQLTPNNEPPLSKSWLRA